MVNCRWGPGNRTKYVSNLPACSPCMQFLCAVPMYISYAQSLCATLLCSSCVQFLCRFPVCSFRIQFLHAIRVGSPFVQPSACNLCAHFLYPVPVCSSCVHFGELFLSAVPVSCSYAQFLCAVPVCSHCPARRQDPRADVWPYTSMCA